MIDYNGQVSSSADVSGFPGKPDPQAEGVPIRPILVVGSGRCGTTLLMQLLLSSPCCAGPAEYPYENRCLSYLLHWARLVDADPVPNHPNQLGDIYHWTKPDNGQLPIEPIAPFPGDRAFLQASPRNKPLWQDVLARSWDVVSSNIQAHHLGRRLRYYAEKVGPVEFDLLSSAMPVHGIFLVRDPRDLWLSIDQFNGKRGFKGFPFHEPPEGLKKLDAAAWFGANLRDYYQRAAGLATNFQTSAIVLRYEDLVLRLNFASLFLGKWLSVLLDPSVVRKSQQHLTHHMTSTSPERSVDRWRSELSPEIAAVITAELRDELMALGYQVA